MFVACLRDVSLCKGCDKISSRLILFALQSFPSQAPGSRAYMCVHNAQDERGGRLTVGSENEKFVCKLWGTAYWQSSE